MLVLSSAENWHIIEISHLKLVKILHNEKRIKIIGWIIGAFYILLLFKLTVFRHDFMQYGLFTNGILRLIPFEHYMKILMNYGYLYFIYLFGGNIVLFIPFGFLLPFLTGKPKTPALIILFGFLLSFVIELSQYAFGTGESELDDLILNTFGVFLGFLLFRYINRHFLRRKGNDSAVREMDKERF